MQHVTARITAHGREAEIHPLYDLFANSTFVERATALQYDYTDAELAMLHYVKGDPTALEAAVDGLAATLEYSIERVDDRRFYAYIRGRNTEGIDDMFAPLTASGLIVVPPIHYHADGTVSLTLFGPEGEFATVIEGAPEQLEVTIESIGGLAASVGVEARLSERQREAVVVAMELGYYDVPRTATQTDVADALGCAPSTAAEHLQKAEATLVDGFLGQ